MDLLDAHNRPVPRYTSYPTVPFWGRDFEESDYLEALAEVRATPEEAVAIYVHVPFCARRCFYCGCNAMVTHKPEVVEDYLDRLEQEIWMTADRVGVGRPVRQLHWGGGTPNFLTPEQMSRLFGTLVAAFDLEEGAEVSVEMDPRIGTVEQVQTLRALGFNRVSLGVQDLDDGVQAAIGRRQTETETVDLYRAARAAGFESVNLDLVYGLPKQTAATFGRTLERIIELQPDRIALFSYAHLPEMRKNQRAIDDTTLPDADAKMGLFLQALDALQGAGYEWIGLDHFARSDDELAVAARERRLQRTFMGYVTRMAHHTLAFGTSGIGYVSGTFVQDDPSLGRYKKALDEKHFPVVRGHRLSRDDLFRQRIIEHLMCNLEVDLDITLGDFGETVDAALPDDVAALQTHVDDGFLEREGRSYRITETGRFFVRNVAATFDPYLRAPDTQPAFSSTV